VGVERRRRQQCCGGQPWSAAVSSLSSRGETDRSDVTLCQGARSAATVVRTVVVVVFVVVVVDDDDDDDGRTQPDTPLERRHRFSSIFSCGRRNGQLLFHHIMVVNEKQKKTT